MDRNQLTKTFINSQQQSRIIESILMIFFIFSFRIIEKKSTINFSLFEINLGEINLGKIDDFTLTSRLIAYSTSFITTIFSARIVGFSRTKWPLFFSALALTSMIYEFFRLLIYFFTSLILYRIYIDMPLVVLLVDWCSLKKLKTLSSQESRENPSD